MKQELALAHAQVNLTRFRPGQRVGHYESFFQRANHPSRPLAFWIRYTIFSPRKHPEDTIGELWAVYFDGETGHHSAVKQEAPYQQCVFKTSEFFVEVASSRLEPGRLQGATRSGQHSIAWDLTFNGEAEPLFLLPARLYTTKLPKAKSLVGMPLATFNGSISVDGQEIEVVDWIGSQNL